MPMVNCEPAIADCERRLGGQGTRKLLTGASCDARRVLSCRDRINSRTAQQLRVPSLVLVVFQILELQLDNFVSW